MPFDAFLNSAAVKLADDAFYAAHPEFHRKDGSRKSRAWCIGISRSLRAEWYRHYREAKRQLIAPATVDARENADPLAVVAPCALEAVAPLCQPIKSVKLTSVSYLNKFVLLNETEKWTHMPALPYLPVDWTPEMEKPNPIVVSFDDRQAFAVKITYRVNDDNACPDTGIIQSVYRPTDTDCLSHEMLEDAELSPGKDHEATLKPYEFPPELIAWNNTFGHPWNALTNARSFDMGTPQNEMYFIWGQPREGRYTEDGATLKRMRAAVNLAAAAKSVDEFKVVEHLFSLFPSYTLGLNHLPPTLKEALDKDKDVLKELNDRGWPSYFPSEQTEKAGAWSILDHAKYRAECQAICRFVRGVMRQLGGRSKIGYRTYTADFSNPTKALNAGSPTGPKSDCEYALVDSAVEIGKTYGENTMVGFNNFEAYLKVKSPGMERSRLFGGGIGLIDEKRHPLACFKALVEYKWVRRFVKTGKGDERVWKWERLIKDMYEYKPDSFADWDGRLP